MLAASGRRPHRPNSTLRAAQCLVFNGATDIEAARVEATLANCASRNLGAGTHLAMDEVGRVPPLEHFPGGICPDIYAL